MNKSKRIKIVIVALCVLILISVIVVAIVLEKRASVPVMEQVPEQTEEHPAEDSPEAEKPEAQPTESGAESTEEQTPEETVKPTKPVDSDDREETAKPTKPADSEKPEETKPADPEEPEETKPEKPEEKPQDPTKPNGSTDEGNKTPDEQVKPPEDKPPFVEIPSDGDPENGEDAGITFPCEVPGYDLVIEKLAPYDGMFVEDGSNAPVSGVAMMLLRNKGTSPVEYMQLQVKYGQEMLHFQVTALPAGESIVVQEKDGKAAPEEKPTESTALVLQRTQMEMSEEQVRVTDNGNNTLTVENLTDKTIPTVRIFYKYYLDSEEMYVGGISFTVRITQLAANSKTVIQPTHFTSQSGRVVMVLTYDEEV